MSEPPKPKSRGRPTIGGLVRARLGELLPDVDHHAAKEHVNRSEMVRRLVAEALNHRKR